MMVSDKIPQGIFIHIHTKGWVDKNGMKLLLEKVWSKCPDGPLEKPALLTCDEFRSARNGGNKKAS
jgi:hypothetical protein